MILHFMAMMSHKTSFLLLAPVWLLLLLLVVQSSPSVESKPTSAGAFEFIRGLRECHKGQSVKGLQDLKRYLERFGYLNSSGKSVRAHDDEFDDLLEAAIEAYQRNYHLNVTGSLDINTVNAMMQPRCGEPDVVNRTTKHVHKSIHAISHFSFFPTNPRWPPQKTHLTYMFRSGVLQVPGTENIRAICARAFQRWGQVTHFTFEEVSSAADIVIGFQRGDHGDGDPFDGFSGILAHAFAPTRGWFHFDADEAWSENPGPNQVDLESVAVHEIGHLLGLAHSQDPNAVMYGRFSYGTIKRDLRGDDVRGIQALYGLQ